MAARSKNELKSLTCLRIPPVKLDELACSDTRDTSSSRLASSASFCAARESSGASLPCSTARSTSCMREDASRQYYSTHFVSIALHKIWIVHTFDSLVSTSCLILTASIRRATCSLSFDTHNFVAQSHLLFLYMPKPFPQGVPVIQVDSLKQAFSSVLLQMISRIALFKNIHAEGTEI